MPPDPPREQGPPGLATPTQINATPTSKTVENPDCSIRCSILLPCLNLCSQAAKDMTPADDDDDEEDDEEEAVDMEGKKKLLLGIKNNFILM